MTRKPIVENRFYPGTKSLIYNQIKVLEEEHKYPVPDEKCSEIIGAVLPHAAHIYSGSQTIPFFLYLKKNRITPDTFVIIHPNHTGIGPSIALDEHQVWENAAGIIETDQALADLLPFTSDVAAHSKEHSAEVIVPFIQYYYQDMDIKILPICMKEQNAQNARLLAKLLFESAVKLQKSICLIASCDFTHFQAPEKAYNKDQLVLDQIKKRSVVGVEKVVTENNISVCGYGPIMTLMAYSEFSGESYASKILARGNSGEVYPSKEVVDYISILFYR